MDMRFEEVTGSDYPLIEGWLKQPHVRRWWDDGEISLEQVSINYGPEEGITRYILSVKAEMANEFRPAGFFQHYEILDGDMGVDLFIGEPDLVGKGIGTEAVKAFSALIFLRFRPDSIFLDPHPENLAAIRSYEKAGFRREGEGVSAEGVPAILMRLCEGEN